MNTTIQQNVKEELEIIHGAAVTVSQTELGKKLSFETILVAMLASRGKSQMSPRVVRHGRG